MQAKGAEAVKQVMQALAVVVLLVAAAFATAGQAGPRVTPVYIVQNPGKDGTIWAVGFGPKAAQDISRRVRVHNQSEAEKMVALLQETAPGRYRFAGLVRI